MSKPNQTLQKVLEYILADEEEKAADLIHEYVVEKARSEYQSILENDEEVEEDIDRYSDMEDDITSDSDEIEADSIGEEEDDLEGDVVVEPEGEFDAEVDGDVDVEGGEGDLEDEVEEIRDELADLQAEFDKLVNGELGDEVEDSDEIDVAVDGEGEFGDDEFGGEDVVDMGDEESFESVEYDLDEAEEVDEDEKVEEDEELDEDDDVVEEATKLSDKTKIQHQGKTGGLPGSEDDASNNKSMFTDAPKPTTIGNGNTGPVKGKDGGDGNKTWKGNDKDVENKTTSNIDVDHKKGPIQHKGSLPDTGDDRSNVGDVLPKGKK